MSEQNGGRETAEEPIRDDCLIRSGLEARLRLAQHVAGVGTFEWDIVNNVNVWSPEIEALYGLPEGGFGGTYEAWRAYVHHDDIAKAEESARQAMETGDFQGEWRIIRPSGEVLWIEARGVVEKDASGRPLRMIGVNIDITDRKRTEEHLKLLTAELSHRVNNTLATIQAIASQTLRSAESKEAFVESFTGRLHAISAAHDILTQTEQGGANIHDLINRQLGPYADRGAGQFSLSGEPLMLGASTAHNLGLVLHELVTNALKHGALSKTGGHVDVSWRTTEMEKRRFVEISWIERGGPPVVKPSREGFGSRLIQRSLSPSVGAFAEVDYAAEGLRARLMVPILEAED